MDYYVSVSLITVAALLMSIAALPMLKVLQLSGYKTRGVFAWWKSTGYDVPIRHFAIMLLGFISVITYVACFGAFEYVRCAAVGLYDIFAIIFVVTAVREKNKVKFTGRVVRIVVLNTIFTLCAAAAVALAVYCNVYFQALISLLAPLSLVTVLLSNAMLAPFEKLNNKKYICRAKAKLDDKKPIVIGITGSYGKTTAKNILKAMLGEKYSVLATPGSYNTPMGVCKTINNELGDEQVFIAELGARYKGDIKELCDIVHPTYGIITAIGDMHLETLKSRENVAAVKLELGESLPETGLLVLNGYNADCKALCERKLRCAVTLSGDGKVYYDKLETGKSGTTFELSADDKKVMINTKLLGAHIAELVCVCAAVAIALGVPLDGVASAVNGMKPVEHRLCIVPSEHSGVTVIDDGYNSNPVGAKNALDVLSGFDCTKVIVTPGFVELGALEKPCNAELGKQIAKTVDYAYLIGSRAADIKKGATAAGMSEDRIKVFVSRDEAAAQLHSIVGEKVVLFENDLPDNLR